MSLADTLNRLRAKSADRHPPETLEIMHRATEALRSSGILDRVLKVGDEAPAFELPNIEGSPVRSSALLANGPLVVTFYRGFW